VKCKLQQDGQKDVKIENIAQWPFARQFLHRLQRQESGHVYKVKVPMQTFAREMHKKQTDINIPVTVT